MNLNLKKASPIQKGLLIALTVFSLFFFYIKGVDTLNKHAYQLGKSITIAYKNKFYLGLVQLKIHKMTTTGKRLSAI